MKSRLFVGEGSFTYTDALLRKHGKDKPGLAKAITATEYRSQEKIEAIPGVEKRLQKLIGLGAHLYTNVDARKIEKLFKGKRFKRIHWNIPHDGSDFKAQTLPPIISDFFQSCAKVQKDGDRVHISLPQPRKKRGGYDFYQGYIYNLVKASEDAGYKLIRKRKFNAERYPGYEHTRTNAAGSSAPVVDEFAREFVFRKIENQELQDGPQKNYEIKSETYYNQRRRYFECSTDDDSSGYSDVESDDETSKSDT
jgi:hypothetical protein